MSCLALVAINNNCADMVQARVGQKILKSNKIKSLLDEQVLKSTFEET
jgi:hypothetical protein